MAWEGEREWADKKVIFIVCMCRSVENIRLRERQLVGTDIHYTNFRTSWKYLVLELILRVLESSYTSNLVLEMIFFQFSWNTSFYARYHTALQKQQLSKNGPTFTEDTNNSMKKLGDTIKYDDASVAKDRYTLWLDWQSAESTSL